MLTDPRPHVRLIAVPKTGNAEIYTLIYSGTPAVWTVLSEITFCKAAPDGLPNCTFVLDSKSGAQLRTEPARLVMTFRAEQAPVEKGTKCLLVSVGAKQVRVAANVNGEKVGKVELGGKFGTVVSSQVVEHNRMLVYRLPPFDCLIFAESHALVLQTDKNNTLAYSLPHLEHIVTVQLPNLSPMCVLYRLDIFIRLKPCLEQTAHY